MHIPDAYLSPGTELAAYAVMAPVWWLAAKKTRRELTSRQTPLLSVCAAFCFAVQMFNIPALGGTTAHPIGTVFVAILLGPWAAVLTMTLTLAVQALFFGDGGLLSLGANSWNMAFVAAFVGYAAFRLTRGDGTDLRRQIVAAAFASFVGSVVASCSAGVMLGAQPLLAQDAAGRALYFPFGWSVAVPAMVHTHLLVAGPAEAIVTALAFAYLAKNFPSLARIERPPRPARRVWAILAGVVLLTPFGLVASGSAWGEWDLFELEKLVGYVPQGIAYAPTALRPVLPDYGLANAQGLGWQIAGYLLSALIGMASVALVIRGAAGKGREPQSMAGPASRPLSTVPTWMVSNDPTTPNLRKAQGRWLEHTVSKTRDRLGRTLAADETARKPGLLQSAPLLPKSLCLLGVLALTGLTHSPLVLGALCLFAVALSSRSSVLIGSLLARAGATTAFLGLIVALPMALMPERQGLALTLLLRLFTGIILTLSWSLTTRTNDVLASLRRLRLPANFVDAIGLSHRFVFAMLDTLAEMVLARRSRQAGAFDKSHARRYAGAGTAILFAKSMALTEDIHQAMRSRSAGRPPGAHPSKSKSQTAWSLASVAVLVFTIVAGVTHVI